MSPEERELAARVDATASAVDGVTRVYPSGVAVGRAARRALGSDHPLSTVRMSPERVEAEVAVGVSGDPIAVGSRVSEAVRAVLPHPAGVRVRIARVG